MVTGMVLQNAPGSSSAPPLMPWDCSRGMCWVTVFCWSPTPGMCCKCRSMDAGYTQKD